MGAIPSPEGIDKLIHERARLGIMSSLAAAGPMTFSELKETLGMTDGNLSVHARVLEEAGYIRIEKTVRRPQAADDDVADGEGNEGVQGLRGVPGEHRRAEEERGMTRAEHRIALPTLRLRRWKFEDRFGTFALTSVSVQGRFLFMRKEHTMAEKWSARCAGCRRRPGSS